MPDRLTDQQLQKIDDRWHFWGLLSSHEREMFACSDIPALLAEIKALKQERDELSGKLAVANGFYFRFEQTSEFIRNRLRRVHRIAEGTRGYEGSDLWREIETAINREESKDA